MSYNTGAGCTEMKLFDIDKKNLRVIALIDATKYLKRLYKKILLKWRKLNKNFSIIKIKTCCFSKTLLRVKVKNLRNNCFFKIYHDNYAFILTLIMHFLIIWIKYICAYFQLHWKKNRWLKFWLGFVHKEMRLPAAWSSSFQKRFS